ncbi:MAG: hypothetical protein RMJ05_07010 [Thermomicrobium sp.]|nr:hypothetical protein [Thermomicrobium sp.]MDW8060014.1 hypothetical protein [Thermomicrobium sp.]
MRESSLHVMVDPVLTNNDVARDLVEALRHVTAAIELAQFLTLLDREDVAYARNEIAKAQHALLRASERLARRQLAGTGGVAWSIGA